MRLLEYDMGEGVRAFSTTREGGVSTGAYAAFNITHYCGDDKDSVKVNRAMLCSELRIDDDRLILPHQTHSSDIICVDEHFLALSSDEQCTMLYAKDAVITALPNLCIGVSTADCVPVLLYDRVKGVIAAVHAGWRGTTLRIVDKCIAKMKELYGTDAYHIKAVIAPSISLDAFEVGDEVYDAFESASFPMEKIARRYGEKWHIDLWEANRFQLINAGVQNNSIDICGICTYNSYNELFSARRLGIKSGRIFNGIIRLL